MSKYLYTLLLGTMLMVNQAGHGSNILNGERIEFPPVSKFLLDNGLRVFYVKDELPQLTIVVSAGFGKIYEMQNNAGISELLSRTLTIAGSKKYPGQRLHDAIDSIGGKFSITSSWESTEIVIKVLKRFKPIAFDIISDLINNPNFNESSFETARALVIEDIKRKYDDPASIAFETAREIIFNGNGYGAVPTEEKVKSYALSDMKSTWDKYFCSKNILLGVSSSLDFEEVKLSISESFTSWKAGEKVDYDNEIEDLKASLKEKTGNIYFYSKDIPQSTIVTGTIAPGISYNGNYSLVLMNYILGAGSFNSRLMKEIRVKRGLAYVVQSIIRSRYKTGVFLAFAQTDNKSVAEVMTLMLENINNMSIDHIKKEELKWAKDAINNSYIFNFDSPTSILDNYLNIEYNNLPGDYFESYLNFINLVTREDVLKESSGLFDAGLIKVIVGNDSVKSRLEKFGKIVYLNQ